MSVYVMRNDKAADGTQLGYFSTSIAWPWNTSKHTYHCTHSGQTSVMTSSDNLVQFTDTELLFHSTLLIRIPVFICHSSTQWSLGNVVVISKHMVLIMHFLWICSQMNAREHFWWQVNIGSGNGLVPSGNKPLPEPMLTQICVAIWHP